MSAKKNAVACSLRHGRAHSCQLIPALANTEQELGTKAERKNTLFFLCVRLTATPELPQRLQETPLRNKHDHST